MQNALKSRLLKPWLPLGACLAITFAASTFLASNCFALVVQDLPAYSIQPSINGLNIAYFAEQDKVKITLYLVNHERFSVLCDARYQGGPDSKDTREQTALPEKAIAFAFSYPSKTKQVVVELICVKPAIETTNDIATPDIKTPEAEPSRTSPVIETDLAVPH